jgi:hypothetical protein
MGSNTADSGAFPLELCAGSWPIPDRFVPFALLRRQLIGPGGAPPKLPELIRALEHNQVRAIEHDHNDSAVMLLQLAGLQDVRR